MIIIPKRNKNGIRVSLIKNGRTIESTVKGVGFMEDKKLINEVCKHHGCFSEFYQIVSKVQL
tara:strand:- start:3345 stop:3530 length:186 start_codon:yes stop_codon:yes gene_type:complete